MYFFRATSPSTILSISECISGSPPGIETIGVPHSSTALKHSSGLNSVFKMCAGYWILPHPAHARLQRNSGSSISTNGYRFCPFSFCLRTYVATVHICEIGTGIVPAYLQEWIGAYLNPQDLLVQRRPQATIVTDKPRISPCCFYSDARDCSFVARDVHFGVGCFLIPKWAVCLAWKAAQLLPG